MNELITLLINSPYATLWMILAAVITVALAALSVIAIVYLRKLLKKLNIDADEAIISAAKTIIKDVVLFYNQKIVDDLKDKSDEGKLTPEQKTEVYGLVLDEVMKLLSNDMIKAILAKYGGEDITVALEILIEATVNENKSIVPKLVK